MSDIREYERQFEELKLTYGDYLNLLPIAKEQNWTMREALSEALRLAYQVMAQGCHSIVMNNHLSNIQNYTERGTRRIAAEMERHGIDPLTGRVHKGDE